MSLKISLTFLCLLTISSGAWAAAEPGSLLHTSETTLRSLEHLHDQAESQILRNDFTGAVETYSQIILIEPDDEEAYAGLGNCYLVQGQFKKANEAYHNALAINPQNETAIIGIQKIMDPDGLEGMVHPSQIEAEETQARLTAPEPLPTPTPYPVEVAPVLQKKPEKKVIPAKPSVSLQLVVSPAHLERLAPEKETVLAPRPNPAPLVPAPIPVPAPVVKKVVPAEKPKIKSFTATPAPKKALPAAAAFKAIEIKPIPASLSDVVDPREVQKALRNTGFYSGPIDGVLGPVSRQGIKNFQLLHELTPDGVIGAKTWASLKLYLDSE